jgi:hypothetical protein
MRNSLQSCSLEEYVMTGSYDFRVYESVPGPSEAELDELVRLGQRFRGHHIFHNVTEEQGIRYMAYSAAAGVRPHTIITSDLAELRDELELVAPRAAGKSVKGDAGLAVSAICACMCHVL